MGWDLALYHPDAERNSLIIHQSWRDPFIHPSIYNLWLDKSDMREIQYQSAIGSILMYLYPKHISKSCPAKRLLPTPYESIPE